MATKVFTDIQINIAVDISASTTVSWSAVWKQKDWGAYADNKFATGTLSYVSTKTAADYITDAKAAATTVLQESGAYTVEEG